MLFNLLLAIITILLCFLFSFCVVFNNFFTFPVVIDNAKVKLTPAISTGAPITGVNDAVERLPLVTDKAI